MPTIYSTPALTYLNVIDWYGVVPPRAVGDRRANSPYDNAWVCARPVRSNLGHSNIPVSSTPHIVRLEVCFEPWPDSYEQGFRVSEPQLGISFNWDTWLKSIVPPGYWTEEERAKGRNLNSQSLWWRAVEVKS